MTVEKGDDGKWTPKGELPDGVTVNPDTGVITLPPSAVKDGSDVTAVATDNAGNSSDPVTETAKPNALIGNPVLSIPEAADKFINADEISDGVQATVTLPQGTSEGAVVTLTISGAENSTVTHTVTAEEAKAGKVDLVIAKDAVDTNGDYSVKADVKQGDHQAVSDAVDFAVDTVVPGDTDGDGKADQAPTVTIPENNDGSVNAEDLKDGIQANVTLPEGTQAGDTVTLTVTNPDGSTSTVTHTVTEDEVTAGSAEVTIPKAQIPTDGEYSVVADIKDAAGNTGLSSEPVKFDVDATVPGDTDGDGTADTTPTITIPEATNGVSKDELSDGVQTEVSLPKGTEAGDTVTLTVTDKDGNTSTVTHTVTQEEIDAGKAEITIPKEQFPTDGDYNVVAEITDPAGNSSGKGTETPVTVDTTAPSAPEVNTPSDGSVEVTLPTDAEVGDTVEITYTPEGSDQPTTAVITKGEDGTWTSNDPNVVVDGDKATIPADEVADGSTVTAVAKDPAGNSSSEDTGTVATPGAPVVTIPENADGGVNAKELEDGVQTNVALPEDTKAGDTVTLTVTNPDGSTSTVTHTVTEDEVTSGSAEVTIPKDQISEDGDYKVVADVTYSDGSKSPTSTATDFKVDATVPGDSDGDGVADDAGAPKVAIQDGDDGFINPKDLNEDGTANVTITFPADSGYQAGDVLTVTNPDGSTQTVTLTADDIANGVTVKVTPVDGQVNEVKAVVKDAAGNTSTEGTDTSTADLKVPGDTDGDGTADSAPVVTIPEATDGVNAKELEDGVQTNVTLPTGTQAGDTVTLSVTNPDGSTSTVTHTVTEAEVTAGSAEVTIPKEQVPTDGNYSVVADIKDAAGNSSLPSAPATFEVDKTIPGDTDGDGVVDSKPTVTIPEATDGVNKDELENGVQTEVTIPKGTEAGDTVVLTVTNPDGTTSTVTHTVTQDEIDSGKAEVTIPKDQIGQDGDYKVTAEIKDPAGNTSGTGDVADFTVDTTAPAAPTVTPSTTDGSVTITPPADADTKSVTVTFEDEDGNTHTVTATKGDDGNWSITEPTDQSSLPEGVTIDPTSGTITIPQDAVEDGSTVTATASDTAGNPSTPGEGPAGKDSPITIDTVAGDDVINATEAKAGVTVTGTALPGQEIVLTDEAGNELGTATTDAQGKWSIPLTADQVKAMGEGAETLTATVKDTETATTRNITVDTVVPGDSDGDGVADDAGAPKVAIQDGDDGFINPKDLNEDGTANVTITFPADSGYQAGDVLTVTNPDGSTQTVTLTADDIANGVTVKVTPVDGQVNEVKAVVKDAAGNTSTEGTDTSTADLKVPGDTDGDGTADSAPVVTIPEAADGVNAKELEDGVQTNVTLPTGTQAGDTVTLSVTNPDGSTSTVTHTVTEAEVTAGSAEVTIPKEQVPTDGNYSVVADIKDAAGNSSLPSAPATFEVDKTIPGDTDGDGVVDSKPTVTIPEATDGVNKDELENGVQTEVTIPKGTEAGDTVVLIVTNPDGTTSTVTHTVTQDEIDSGKADVTIPKDQIGTDGDYKVTAEIKDPAGNTSGTGDVADFTVDTTAPAAPTVTPSTTDGSVTITPPADADTKSVTINFTDEQDQPQTVKVVKNADGTWAIDGTAPTGVTVDPATGVVTIAQDAVKDGSTVTATASDTAGNSSTPETGTAGEDSLITIDTVAGDDVINATEAKAGVTVTGTALPGQEIVLTDEAGNVLGTVTTGEDGKWSVPLTADQVKAMGEGAETLTATVKGTTTTATRDISVDTQIPGGEDTDGDGKGDEAPVITFVEDTNSDGLLNSTEVGGDGKTTVNIAVPTGTAVGDTLIVTINDVATEVPVTAEILANGYTKEVPVTDGEKITVTASVQDAAGNESAQASKEATVDIATPTISINPISDGFINAAETNADLAISGTTTAEAGQTVTVTLNGKEYTAVVGNDGTWTATVPAADVAALAQGDQAVTANVSDKAGNPATEGTANVVVDTVVPTLTVDVADAINADNVSAVPVSGTSDLPNGSEVKITLTDADGNTVTVTATVTDGKYETTVDASGLKDGAITATASSTATDAAGNAPADATDTTANSKDSSAPTLSIDPISEGYINAAEAKGEIAISGTTTAEAGQTVTVTLNGKEYTAVVENDGTWTATVPAADVAALAQGDQAVTANVSDKAGNPATEAKANVVVDTVVPTLTVDVADTINATNASAVPVSGTSDLPNGSEVKITLTDADGNTVTVTATVTDGKYETTVDASSLKDGAITATASSSATDAAGNAPADATDATENIKDTTPSLEVTSLSVPNSVDEGSNAVFTVSLAEGHQGGTIDAPVLGGTATAVADYGTAIFSNGVTVDSTGKLVIPVGVTNFTISYPITEDQLTEGNETLSMDLGGKSAATTINDTSLTTLSISVANPEQREDDSSEGSVMTFTVTASQPATEDTKVTIDLSGQATAADYILAGGTVSGSQVTVIIKAGETTASFTLDPILEANLTVRGKQEGQETVVATITSVNDTTVTADTANNTGTNQFYDVTAVSTDGLIINSNPVAMITLTGDYSLLVGPIVTGDENNLSIGADNSNAEQATQAEGGIVTTDYDDIIYLGYTQDGEKDGYGNISNAYAAAGNGTITDGNVSWTTIDLAKGDDHLKMLGTLNQLARVYAGEGNDIIEIGGSMVGFTGGDDSATIFAESGDDTITIDGNIQFGSIYTGSGSDTIIIGGDTSFYNVIDLGSGNAMPNGYQSTYSGDNSLSLGNDNNIDLSTDKNNLTINGGVGDSAAVGITYIYGGAGVDNITVAKTIGDKAVISTGANDDTLTAGVITSGAKIDMGTGIDTVTLSGSGNSFRLTENVKGAEIIDINGSGANTLYVNADNVRNSGAEEIIKIQGGSDDTVNLGYAAAFSSLGETLIDSTKWAATGNTLTEDGHTYAAWQYGSDTTTLIYIESTISNII
ncbi:beta strand repeat-containing protein [Testudinibacter aquarius]|uniref:beta strand repeat-containing protein n=1 Tax=Testudinibacter aquarius TaxID=1524974 RepID=UPI001C3F2A23|nr:Ig-like domain-containing protein [Testudinibacter aquarius]